MKLSPDETIFWEQGFITLNLTIVTTWVLMLVMVIAARLITRNLKTDIHVSRWQCFLDRGIVRVVARLPVVPGARVVAIGTALPGQRRIHAVAVGVLVVACRGRRARQGGRGREHADRQCVTHTLEHKSPRAMPALAGPAKPRSPNNDLTTARRRRPAECSCETSPALA